MKKTAAKSAKKTSKKSKLVSTSGSKSAISKKAPVKTKTATKLKAKTAHAPKTKASIHTSPGSGPKVGDWAPAFSIQSDDGTVVSSKSLKGKTVILYFYPKDMTSGCTAQACDFRDFFPKFKKENIVVVGISKDSMESHVKFKTKYLLPFHLLADTEGAMCEAYGVWKEKSMYGRKYMGIERTTFVINPEGRIAAIYSKVKVPKHVETLYKELLG